MKKKILAKKGVCKVTFNLPSSIAETAKTAHVVGEFNNWDPQRLPMKKNKRGKFYLSIELPLNKEYEFRYVIDGTN